MGREAKIKWGLKTHIAFPKHGRGCDLERGQVTASVGHNRSRGGGGREIFDEAVGNGVRGGEGAEGREGEGKGVDD